jgi:hypothetical protein
MAEYDDIMIPNWKEINNYGKKSHVFVKMQIKVKQIIKILK